MNTDEITPKPNLGRRRLNWILAIVLVLGIAGGLVYFAYTQLAKANIINIGGNSDQSQTSSQPEVELLVTVVKPTRTITNPSTEITVISNKEITIGASNRMELQKLGEKDGDIYYILRVKNLGVEATTLEVEFKAGKESYTQAIQIQRQPFTFPPGFQEMGDWPDSEYVLDGNDYGIVVDKKHRLLEDYEPSDLVDLNKEMGIFTYNNAMLRAEAARNLKTMLDDLAKETGKYVTVASGYRSYETQVSAYSGWVKQLGEAGADRVSAKPGHSQHQLGTTIDFVSEDTGWQINSTFGDTVAGKWLADNCHEYGFNLPYREDQSTVGGYAEESWHFRFVGITE